MFLFISELENVVVALNLLCEEQVIAHSAMDHWIDPSWWIHSASTPKLECQKLWYVLSCLWDDAYKISLAANQKEKVM